MNTTALNKTGRTTRMMEEALAARRSGREVIVIVKDEAQRKHIEDNFETTVSGIRIEPINAHPHFDWRRLTIPGAGEKFAFFVDHYVIENRFEAVLEMLHRFDPPNIQFSPKAGHILIIDDPMDEEQIARMQEPENQKKIKEWMDRVLSSPEQRQRVEATCLPTGSRGRPQNKEEVDEVVERLRKAPTKLRAWDMAANTEGLADMAKVMTKVETEVETGVPTKVATMAKCQKPPAGWTCTRPAGHDGPCAAVPTSEAEQKLDKVVGGAARGTMAAEPDQPEAFVPTSKGTINLPKSAADPRVRRSISKNPRPINKNAKPKGPYSKK